MNVRHLIYCNGWFYAGQIPYGLSQHILPVPVYRVGSNLIKADLNLTQSVLASSLWQYWQRGFCASFPLPLSVQRVLPSDAPFLQAGDGRIADFDRNRQLLKFRMLDSRKVGRAHCIAVIITSRKWHTYCSLVLHTKLILEVSCSFYSCDIA